MQHPIDATLNIADRTQLEPVASTSADPVGDVLTERIELGVHHRLVVVKAWHHLHVQRRILPRIRRDA